MQYKRIKKERNKYMKELKLVELEEISGGSTTVTAAFLGAIFSGCKVIYTIGQALGSSIRRISGDNICKI